MDRSPYEEQPDERRQCAECGGTKTVAGQDCSLCGPPSKPDPEAQRQLFVRTAEMLRRQERLAGRNGNRELEAYFRTDAEYFERRAAQMQGSKEVA